LILAKLGIIPYPPSPMVYQTMMLSLSHCIPPVCVELGKKCILIRKINACSINDFILKLSHENWDSVFSSDDVNVAFNSFLDSYLKIFNSSFPLKRVYTTKKTITGLHWES
jgi:hypothetical protein